MKLLACLFYFVFILSASSAVPTEEGLLKNLNNAVIPGNLITVKTMVQASDLIGASENKKSKADFYKFVISLENPNAISLLQIAYTGSQMLNAQTKDIKYIPDLLSYIKKEKSLERGMFYSVLMMLTTNNSQGMEVFLEKSGVKILKNKNILNQDKMKLLRSYRNYLANNKGKGEANSPLNPSDAQEKAQVVALFRANTFERSKNIELVKYGNEFMWKADWKSIQAYFTNEERRLRQVEFTSLDITAKIEANEYISFNGTNELPKFIQVKDTKGQLTKIQVLGLDTKANPDKKLSEKYEEAKKLTPNSAGEIYSFLY